MGKYQAYPEYKDSGVELLGEIPGDWSVWKLSHFAPIITCGVASTPDYTDEGVIFLSAQNVKNRKIDLSKGFKLISRQKHGELTKNRTPRNGDLLLSRVGTVGEACIIDVDFDFSIFVSLTHLRLNTVICTNEYFIWLCESAYIKNMHGIVTLVGGGVGNLNVNDLREYQIPVPSIDEQQKIAAFLDHETAKIDALIEKQQQLIQLLKEKRQAVISHAVTKGLNPNAPMKDSGIEWLGEVPVHWEVVPIKRVCEVKDGTHDTPVYVDESHETFPLITSKDFFNDDIAFENAKFISKADHFEIVKRSNTELGDVLMSMIGGNIGKALLVKTKRAFSIKNVALFKTRGDTDLAKFVLFYLQSGLLDVQISLLSRGGAQGFLSLGDLRNLIFFKVPRAELPVLIKYLEVKVIYLDRLISEAEHGITLLQERRTALISAAVTGKIDVRNFAEPATR